MGSAPDEDIMKRLPTLSLLLFATIAPAQEVMNRGSSNEQLIDDQLRHSGSRRSSTRTATGPNSSATSSTTTTRRSTAGRCRTSA
jgi:hypothetical protein